MISDDLSNCFVRTLMGWLCWSGQSSQRQSTIELALSFHLRLHRSLLSIIIISSRRKMSKRRPVISVFTFVENVPSLLRETKLPLVEISDPALQGRGATISFDASRLTPETCQQLNDAEILITEPAALAQLIQHLPLSNLKWCQSTYAGVDPLFTTPGVPLPLPFTVTRCGGMFGPPIAEWCLARIIGHERNFQSSFQDQQRKEWLGSSDTLQYRYLSDLTLTILGCGDIGLTIARAAKAFGMRVVGYSRSIKDNKELDMSETNLVTALQQADYVVSVLPSTQATRGLLSTDVFQNCNTQKGGKSPVFVNVGRGDVTSTAAIVSALDANNLSAAILDVFEEEPLSKENPLWSHPKVVVSPHISGLTRPSDVPNLVKENYERYVDGSELKFAVDWDKAYYCLLYTSPSPRD